MISLLTLIRLIFFWTGDLQDIFFNMVSFHKQILLFFNFHQNEIIQLLSRIGLKVSSRIFHKQVEDTANFFIFWKN